MTNELETETRMDLKEKDRLKRNQQAFIPDSIPERLLKRSRPEKPEMAAGKFRMKELIKISRRRKNQMLNQRTE